MKKTIGLGCVFFGTILFLLSIGWVCLEYRCADPDPMERENLEMAVWVVFLWGLPLAANLIHLGTNLVMVRSWILVGRTIGIITLFFLGYNLAPQFSSPLLFFRHGGGLSILLLLLLGMQILWSFRKFHAMSYQDTAPNSESGAGSS